MSRRPLLEGRSGGFSYGSSGTRGPANQKRGPTLSTHEAADEFGVDWRSLASRIARSNTAPKPCVQCRASATRSQVTYYDAAEIRAWWKAQAKS